MISGGLRNSGKFRVRLSEDRPEVLDLQGSRTLRSLFWGGIVGAISVGLNPLGAIAQIIPDSTLPTNSQVLPGCTVCTIEGGTVRGSNLFHSFSQFSVPTGGQAIFNNPGTIQNILTRVTGTTLSTLDGLIQANGTANLFLLNPNGIVFGPNARLQLGGSFVASTANAIQFGNQGFFSATNPESPDLLTVQPSALWFNQQPVGRIENRSVATVAGDVVGLQVPNGRSIVLVGGEIEIAGGRLTTFGGQVELASAKSGVVGLTVDGDRWQLQVPDSVERSNISFTNATRVRTFAGGGGSINTYSQNLTITGGSRLSTGIVAGFTGNRQAGDLRLQAIGDIVIQGTGSGQTNAVENFVDTGTIGNSGNVYIAGRSLVVAQGAIIRSSTFGQGNAGNVLVEVRDLVSVDGALTGGVPSNTGVLSNVERTGIGRGGNIQIVAGSIEVLNGAQLQALIRGVGDGGDVILQARDRTTISGIAGTTRSLVGTSTLLTGRGNSGKIEITTGSLAITNNGRLSSTSFNFGNAGDILIQAREHVNFDTLGTAFSSVDFNGQGQGGDIYVTARSLSLSRESGLISVTGARSDAGNIVIDVQDQVSLEATSRISSGALPPVTLPTRDGNGGNIEITANRAVGK